MDRILECVPNISEGRNSKIINSIANEINKIENVKLLHIDSNKDANRTVITFAGEPGSVYLGAYNLVKKAAELIDMRKHKGVHPRFGAVDVCPFIPISGISMDETIKIARNFGRQIANDLSIHIYLYENAAAKENRKKLENCRRGEYEGLEEKIKNPEWKPDFGPDLFNIKTGATAVGARNYLIAYNINLETKSVDIAKRIAGEIRESGTKNKQPGLFKHVKAIGWYIKEYNVVQVSTNITNPDKISVYEVFDKVEKLAIHYKTKIIGSEIVGLIPLKYILNIKENHTLINNDVLISNAIKYLKLNHLYPFIPENKILDLLLYKHFN
ncbi:glutamate formimidoyltransferase [Bacteroidota bacterium]